MRMGLPQVITSDQGKEFKQQVGQTTYEINGDRSQVNNTISPTGMNNEPITSLVIVLAFICYIRLMVLMKDLTRQSRIC